MPRDLSQDWEALMRWSSGPVSARPTERCGRVRCEPGWSWQVRLRDFDLWSVVDGYGSATVDDVEYDLRPGDVLHLRPGALARVEQDPDRRFTIAYCHYEWSGADRTAAPPAAIHVRLTEPLVVQNRMTALIRLAGARRPLVHVERAALLQLALVEVYRQQAAGTGAPN
ncbi:MAG: cupin domain-containing protein, partial [Dermatophilaceae bacterium]